MNLFHNGAGPSEGKKSHESDRKVKLLLVLLIVLGGTLAFLATPFSERTLGIKLSSLFSSASILEPGGSEGPGTGEGKGRGKDEGIGPFDCIQAPCEGDGGTVVNCVREPCGSTDGGGTKIECLAAPCLDTSLSILNPKPKSDLKVGNSYKISWDGRTGEKVDITLKPQSCDNTRVCAEDIMIVDDGKNLQTFEWQIPPNISSLYVGHTSRLVVTVDDNYYNQIDVQIIADGGDTSTTDEGTYIRFARNPYLVYRIEKGAKRAMPYPYQEVMRCLGADPTTVKDGTQLQQALPDGNPLFCNPFSNGVSRNGSLLSGFPDSDRTAIYLVEDGKRRPFPTGEIFECLGYNYTNVHLAGSKDVANPGLPIGEPMSCSGKGAPLSLGGDGTLPNGIVNVNYNARIIATGGVQPYSWKVLKVEPSGTASFNEKGQLSAKFTQAGTYKISVEVCDNSTDFAANCVKKIYTLNVDKAGGNGGGSGGGRSSGSKGQGKTTTPPTVPVVEVAKNCVSNDTSALVPLYRYYSSSDTDHYYSTSSVAPGGFVSEGITAYIYNQQLSGTVPVYQSYNKQSKEHYYTTDSSATQSYGYKLDGVVGYAYPTQVTGSYAMYRMFNTGTKHYLISTSTEERDAIMQNSFVQQGTVGYACGVPRPGSELVAIYRLWSPKATDHMYTVDVAERDAAIRRGYKAEGIAGHLYSVPGEGRVPLYRAYSSKLTNHFYSTSEQEIKDSGYAKEGVMGFIADNPSSNLIQWYRLFHPVMVDHFYTTSTEERDQAVKDGYRFEGTIGYLP